MVKHIVCWKLHEEAQGREKAENAQLIKNQLLKLKERIPQIQTLEVGINDEKANPQNFDVVLISEFGSFEELEIYQKHKDHQEFIRFIDPLRSDKVAVDYEI